MKPHAIVMHPGPMNRGVEISVGGRRLGPRRSILDQVNAGVAVRMAAMYLLLGGDAEWRCCLEEAGSSTPPSGSTRVCDVVVDDGRIVEIGEDLDHPEGHHDRRVRREGRRARASWTCTCTCASPGYEYKETIASGTRAAAHGGFTAVCAMPNTDPVCDEGARCASSSSARPSAAWCACYPIGALPSA